MDVVKFICRKNDFDKTADESVVKFDAFENDEEREKFRSFIETKIAENRGE